MMAYIVVEGGSGVAKPEGRRFSFGTIVAIVLLIGCMYTVFVLTEDGTVVIEYPESELDDIRSAIRDKVQTIRNRTAGSTGRPSNFELILQNVADSADAIVRRYNDDILTLEKTDDILKGVIESIALAPNTTAANPQILSLYQELQRVEAGGGGGGRMLEPPPDDQ